MNREKFITEPLEDFLKAAPQRRFILLPHAPLPAPPNHIGGAMLSTTGQGNCTRRPGRRRPGRRGKDARQCQVTTSTIDLPTSRMIQLQRSSCALCVISLLCGMNMAGVFPAARGTKRVYTLDIRRTTKGWLMHNSCNEPTAPKHAPFQSSVESESVFSAWSLGRR